MQDKKLTFYRFGLISLIGLPIIMILFMPEPKKQEVSITMTLPADKVSKDAFLSKVSTQAIIANTKGKKIETIYFSRDKYDGFIEDYNLYKKKEFIIREMERLQFTNETSTVLKIELNDNNTYGDFIWLLNQTIIYRYKRYALVDYTFYVFPNERPIDFYENRNLPIIIDGNQIVSNDKSDDTYLTWQRLKAYTNFKFEKEIYVVKENYIVVWGFVILILVPSLYRQFRRNKTNAST